MKATLASVRLRIYLLAISSVNNEHEDSPQIGGQLQVVQTAADSRLTCSLNLTKVLVATGWHFMII